LTINPSSAAPPTFTPGENVLLTLGNTETATASIPTNDLAVGPHTSGASGGLPFTTSVLPARPNLPDDPVIPHNGFQTFEEGEKAFMHLLRKAGVDAGWTWDMTMRAIITDPLYKALSTLAEKKAAWQKVMFFFVKMILMC
jgi:pre-mRNA-processing factor 40